MARLAQPQAGIGWLQVSGWFDSTGQNFAGVETVWRGSPARGQFCALVSVATVPMLSFTGAALSTSTTLPRATLISVAMLQSGAGKRDDRQSAKVSASSPHHSISTMGWP